MSNTRPFNQQRGVVLIVSLVILVLITLIAVTGMRITMNEERMAGNIRDRSLAFQAAEAALRDAEVFLANPGVTMPPTATAFPGSSGLLNLNDAEPDYYQPTSWVAGTSQDYTGLALPSVRTAPRFIVKYIGARQELPSAGVVGSPNYVAQASEIVHLFKITARGTGQTDNAQVILQSYFGRN